MPLDGKQQRKLPYGDRANRREGELPAATGQQYRSLRTNQRQPSELEHLFFFPGASSLHDSSFHEMSQRGKGTRTMNR
jgi:hypothetical protein